jgi:hypothetical protein
MTIGGREGDIVTIVTTTVNEDEDRKFKTQGLEQIFCCPQYG